MCLVNLTLLWPSFDIKTYSFSHVDGRPRIKGVTWDEHAHTHASKGPIKFH